MAARGFHHGGVSVNPCDLAPNHTGSVFGNFAFLKVFIEIQDLGETVGRTTCRALRRQIDRQMFKVI